MYAIVSIAGQQFKVEKGKKVFVHRLAGSIGDDVSFDKVLLISDNDKVNVGAPFIPNVVVQAQIVSQLKGDKVLVFKKKRRKGYQKLNGHRQCFTEIMIVDIGESVTPKKAEKKKPDEIIATAEVESAQVRVAKTVKAAAPKTAAKKVAEPPAKKPAAKKPAEKKPAAKESAVKKPAEKKPVAKKAAEKKPEAKKTATAKPVAKTESKPKK